MCRIAGIIDKSAPLKQLEKDVKLMCDSMQHGGPDDEGFYTDESIGLSFGHRRLALIDLSSLGHQPMQTREEKLVITFNGEIYNFKELKTELLALGYPFQTQSDTEVILAAYQIWGTESFRKFNGMFAFALHDHFKNLTYLVRDPSGIKPLYYSTQQNRLVFSSEVKAFEKTSYQFPEKQEWKIYFLAFGHIPQPFTTLQDVFSLKPGNFLTWNHEHQTNQITSFEPISPPKVVGSALQAADQVRIKLEDAVNCHMVADAPIGVFLSGGIDSSIITLLADKKTGRHLNSLSIHFGEKAFSEEEYQRLITAKTSGVHQTYLVEEQDLKVNFETILNAMDQPTNDGINSWFVNKYAKENGLKAVLSGIGADELLGGYPSFNRMGIIRVLKKLPAFILKYCGKLPSEKLKRIYYLSYQNPIGEYLFLRGFYIPETIAKILNINNKEIDELFEAFPIDKKVSQLNGAERASWFETHIFMQNQLLKDTDFMSMSHGIEVRVPFLDQNFLETIDGIAPQQRFPAEKKGLLIEAFKNILPEAVWNRPKMGFSFPLQQWFIKGGQISNEEVYADNQFAIQQIQKFKAGKMHWSKAFALYQVFRKN
ncbi:asparagine synthase (glutamine-hydrolyzing) [Pedobacter sp. CFBP9032]|uniref:asparagine synthase (glutamine-hydrolyzing) n=1 Tax=Pedobacter sp. CFBP9032 TaxID=3096539 RepID=UPI002A6A96C8|nr:asparagine synthase (glutamine-hydrolyzing) [Pedobacter sp. CFBP9032]MDY0907436.1 asparagine synthase (glutamine-hydrolyzing) [Pedobacter sp. CFBP9032]